MNSQYELKQEIYSLKAKLKNLCGKVKCCLGISPNGDETLFLNQQGNWVEAGSSGGDAWLKTGNAGTDPTINFVGTTDDAGLNIIGGSSSTPDVGIFIDGKSDSKEGVVISGESSSENGVVIYGDSDSGVGVLIEGYSLPGISAIHLKSNSGVIRLSGIDEGSEKILVSMDNSGGASWVSPNIAVFNFNEYVNDAAADADVTLPSGGLYKLTGGRTIFQKP